MKLNKNKFHFKFLPIESIELVKFTSKQTWWNSEETEKINAFFKAERKKLCLYINEYCQIKTNENNLILLEVDLMWGLACLSGLSKMTCD